MSHHVNRRLAAKITASVFGSLLPRAVFSQSVVTLSADADPVVARVLTTEIRSSQKMHLNGIIFGALLQKYAGDHALSASEEEITRFRLKIWPSDSDSESKESIKIHNELAQNAIVLWKINLALFKTYGGRVSFQQMGYEPIDAYRAFLEEQARLGAFEIIDKSLEAGFWAYFISENHRFITGDGEEVLRRRFWESK